MDATVREGYLLAAAALVLFAINIIVNRLATRRADLALGFVVAVVVNVVFAAFAFALRLAFSDDAFHWDPAAAGIFLLAGVFATFLGRWLFFESVVVLGPAKASTFQSSSPLFTAALGWALLGERLPATTLAAIAAAAVGLYIVGAPTARAARVGAPRTAGVRGRHFWRSGLALGAGSSCGYAIGNVLRGMAVHRWQEPVLGGLLGALAGVVLHLATSRRTRTLVPALRAADRGGLALYAMCGVLTIAAQTLTITAMARAPTAVVALITLCTPVLVYPMSFLFLRNDEGITLRTVAGATVALLAVAFIVAG